MLKAVARHATQPWVMLYVERWLKAPMLRPDGALTRRTQGTPQGGPISPLIANIFLHYGFDTWMSREFPGVGFERFADLCRARHKSAYADFRVMPRERCCCW